MIKPSQIRAWQKRKGFIKMDLACGENPERLINFAKRHPHALCIGVDNAGFKVSQVPKNVKLLKEDIFSENFRFPAKVKDAFGRSIRLPTKIDEIEVNFFGRGAPPFQEKWVDFLKDKSRVVIRFDPRIQSGDPYEDRHAKIFFEGNIGWLAYQFKKRGFNLVFGIQHSPKKRHITEWEKEIFGGNVPKSLEEQISEVKKGKDVIPERLKEMTESEIKSFAEMLWNYKQTDVAKNYPFLIATRKKQPEHKK